MLAKSRWALATAAMAVGLVVGSGASAESLTGFCLDNLDAGCLDRLIPFDGNSIGFCEETCELTKPTAVRDLNATLYDFVCRGDSATGGGGRVMILRQKDWNGKSTISFIDEHETRPVVQCR